jgi:MFS transporter, DHA1 family, tetracycline resistance protein
MIDKKMYKLLLPSVVVIFIDTLSRSLVYPLILILALSSRSPLLPADTPIKTRFLYLTFLLMVNPFFKLIGSNYIGNLSDMIKRRTALMISCAGLSIVLILAGIAIAVKSFIFFVIIRCIMGLFGSSKSVAMAAIIDRVPSQERSRSLSFANFGYTFGIIIGPLLAGILSDKTISSFFSLSFPFYAAGVLSIGSVIWVYFIFPETFGKKHTRQFTWKELYLPFVRTFQYKKTQLLFPHILLLDLGTTIFSISIWIFLTHTMHYSSLHLGLFFVYQGSIALIATFFVISRLTHIYCTEKLITISLALITILILIQSAFINVTSVWILAGFSALLMQVNYTCVYANASHAVGKHLQGWAMGMATGAISLSWLFGSFSTNLIEIIGMKHVLYIAAAASFISMLLIIWQRWRFHPSRLEENIDPTE